MTSLWGVKKKRLKIPLVSGLGLFKWDAPSRTVKDSGVNVILFIETEDECRLATDGART